MTRPDLDAIRARCDAATPGPWAYDEDVGYIEMEEVGYAEFLPDWQRSVRRQPPLVARMTDTWGNTEDDGRFIACARTDIPALLAYVEELEADAATLRHRDVLLKRVHGALADMCCRVPMGIDEPVDAIVRASLARANQRFVDEYDARVSAEERALTAEERLERVTHERDQERQAFEQAMVEAQTDVMKLRARIAEVEKR